MKRLLSLAVLLCSLFLTHVNGQIGFVYQDRTYQNGDTLVVVLAPNAHQCQGIFIKNVAPVALTDLTASLTPIEENGIEAWDEIASIDIDGEHIYFACNNGCTPEGTLQNFKSIIR